MNDNAFILAATLAIGVAACAALCAAVINHSQKSRDETAANLEAELQAKDAAVAMYQQLLDAKQREIDLQEKIIHGLSLKLKVALQLKDIKERHIKELTEKNEPEQQIKGDN